MEKLATVISTFNLQHSMGKKPRDRKGPTKKKPAQRKPTRVKEVVFDPEARQAYLQGFSDRKKQRRVFGLAMQQVKDRQSKLDDRADRKKAMEEQVEAAEKQKEELRRNEESKQEKRFTNDIEQPVEEDRVETFADEQTQTKWGGSVVVTTTTNFFDSEEDDDNPTKKKSVEKKKHDREQEYAGDVQRYIRKVQGQLPSKKKKGHVHKGTHGAASMTERSGDFKTAQKVLAMSEAKKRKGSSKVKRR